jgi:DNA-binding CsgD family transcriptional regulator
MPTDKTPDSFFDYLRVARDYRDYDTTEALSMIHFYNNRNSVFHGAMPVVYLIDYTVGRYVFISHTIEHISGYSSGYVLDGGPELFRNVCWPKDFDIVNKNVFPGNLQALMKSPDGSRNFVFSHNFRLRKKTGEMASIFQHQSVLQSTPEGYPLVSIGFMFDITSLRYEKKIVHTIEECADQTDLYHKKLLLRKYYFPEEPDGLLSKREVEVLKWICDGLSSKQIADKMFLSIHTVNNHRKHMLEKTNCRNAAELLHYAIVNGYL